MNKSITALLLLPACALLPGCAAKQVAVPNLPPTERQVQIPATSKSTPPPPPSSAYIPATQRPYQIDGKTYYPLPSAEGFAQDGRASWYGNPFHGRKTSNGETYDMHGMTAAHKTLPMNTQLLVKNLDNGREAVVRVNDRGPFVKGRIIDLSYAAAEALGMAENGTAPVHIVALGEAASFRQGAGTVERFLPHQDFNRGEFFVQIGAFTSRDNARRLVDKMLASGRKTVIQTYEEEGRTFYRVQVRAGTELDHAKQVESTLTAAGFPDAFTVAR